MPGPPHSSWRSRPRARSQSITGEVRPEARTVNSRETQAGTMLRSASRPMVRFPPRSGSRPGSPNRCGQGHRAPEVDHAPGEGEHVGRDPRDLGQHDHGRAVPGPVDGPRHPLVVELGPGEAVDLDGGGAHRRTLGRLPRLGTGRAARPTRGRTASRAAPVRGARLVPPTEGPMDVRPDQRHLRPMPGHGHRSERGRSVPVARASGGRDGPLLGVRPGTRSAWRSSTGTAILVAVNASLRTLLGGAATDVVGQHLDRPLRPASRTRSATWFQAIVDGPDDHLHTETWLRPIGAPSRSGRRCTATASQAGTGRAPTSWSRSPT